MVRFPLLISVLHDILSPGHLKKGNTFQSVIESKCLYVCARRNLSSPSDIYFEASHWRRDQMISSRPLFSQPARGESELPNLWTYFTTDYWLTRGGLDNPNFD